MICRYCNIEKPITEFRISYFYKDKPIYGKRCRKCQSNNIYKNYKKPDYIKSCIENLKDNYVKNRMKKSNTPICLIDIYKNLMHLKRTIKIYCNE